MLYFSSEIDFKELSMNEFHQKLTQIRHYLHQHPELSGQEFETTHFLRNHLEKLDITEEKIRLKKHLDYFLETLHSEDSNGRKLSFIAQEIGREINTLGSKANFAPMQQLVVQMKDELEKIKEQVLNVL